MTLRIVGSVLLIVASFIMMRRTGHTWTLSATVVILLSSVLLLSMTGQRRGWLVRWSPFLLLAVFFVGAQIGYNLSIRDTAYDTYVAILQTFPQEAFWFVDRSAALSRTITGVFIACIGGVVAIKLLPHRSPTKLEIRVLAGLVCAAIVVCIPSAGREGRKIGSALVKLVQHKLAFTASPLSIVDIAAVRKDDRPLSVVVVLGESTSRWNSSLYGYPRDTFAALRNIEGSLIFTDAVAPHVHTMNSVLATFARHRAGSSSEQISLLGILNKAGIKTAWYSNQNEFGIWDNPVTYLGKTASHFYFHRKTLGEDYMGKSYDSDLLDYAKREMIQIPPSSATVFHMYAAHWPYCKVIPSYIEWTDALSRLPPTAIYGRFKGADKPELDCYDGAVAYAARTVRNVIDWTSDHENPIVVVYFPDHGDDVFSNRSHDSSDFSHKMAEIPMLMHFNAAAKRGYQAQFDALAGNQNKRIDTANVFELMLDLFAIDAGEYSNPAASIASSQYLQKDRVISDREDDGSVSYDNPYDGKPVPDRSDAYIKQKSMLSRLNESQKQHVCAHRNNTYLKLAEALSLFECAELDVVLNAKDRSAMVQHDEDDPTGLPLNFVLSLPHAESKRLWLDVKNLSEDNVQVLIEALDRSSWAKDKLLVEVSAELAGSSAVAKLVAKQFQVSYYLPTELGIKCSSEQSAECSKFQASTEANLKSGFSSLSFDFNAVNFVKRLRVPPGVSLSTWDLDVDLKDVAARKDVTGFNYFLVNFASEFDH